MPGNADAGRGPHPYRLSILEMLLQGYPGEFMPVWSPDQREADLRHGVSDRQLMTEAAEAWSRSTVLTAEERDRIRVVWLEGTYRPAHNLDTARRDELTGRIHRSAA